MRFFLVLISILITVQAYASEIKIECTNPKGNDKEEYVLNAETLDVRISGNTIYFKTSFAEEMTGTYEKLAKNGSYIYSSVDLLDVADQTDYAYVFVSPSLENGGKKGKITLSVRQLGDSE